jgi:hypothetical protein
MEGEQEMIWEALKAIWASLKHRHEIIRQNKETQRQINLSDIGVLTKKRKFCKVKNKNRKFSIKK